MHPILDHLQSWNYLQSCTELAQSGKLCFCIKWKILMLQNKFIIKSFFFLVCELAVFYKSCNLIGSKSGQYSPHSAHSQQVRFFLQPLVRFWKKIKMLFTSQGRSALGKNVPSVLCAALSLSPWVVSKTSGTFFPNTDLPSGE